MTRTPKRFHPLLALSLNLAPAVFGAAAPPAPPRVWLDTTLAVQTGRTWTVAPKCGDLQASIDGARPGDTIVIPQAARCVGNYVLPRKPAGAGWIVIQGSSPKIPPAGTRMKPEYAPMLPKIVAPGSAAAVATEPGAHHYRLVGLEITVAPAASINYGLVALGDPSGAQNSLDRVPTDLVIDRCYIHGNPAQNVKRGVGLDSASSAVVDSYIAEIHSASQDTQAIGGFNGPGPFKIVNNYLEAAGENIIFGGALSLIPNLVPSDIEIRGNHLFKPLSWKAGHPSYAGIPWQVKNLLELKNARRALIDGNVLEYNWSHAQTGFAILFTVRTENGRMPWNAVEDVAFTHNIVRHVSSVFNILGRDSDSARGASGITQRILIQNNIFDDVSAAKFGGFGLLYQFLAGPRDIKVDHNTGIQDLRISTAEGQPPVAGFEFTNNIQPHNKYGMFGSGQGYGNQALDYYFPGAIVVKNVLAGGPASMYPPRNFFPPDLDGVGFVNLATGDYHLRPASRYRRVGTDGKDPGADVDAVLKATHGVVTP